MTDAELPDKWTRNQLWAKLEADGEDIVRERLATKTYGDVGPMRSLVEEWLRSKAESRSNALARRASIKADIAIAIATVSMIKEIALLMLALLK